MAKTIEQLAQAINKSSEELLKHAADAGLPHKKASDPITGDQEVALIECIQKAKSGVKRRAPAKQRVVRRKSHTQVKTGRGQGSGTVAVEVRRSKVVKKKAAKSPEPAEPPVESETEASKPAVAKKAKAPAKTSDREKRTEPSQEQQPVPLPEKKPQRKSKADSRDRKQLHIDSEKRTNRKKEPKTIAPRSVKVARDSKHAFEKPTKPVQREVSIPDTLTVTELAQRLAIKRGDLVKELMGMNIMVTVNQALDQDTAVLIVEELGHIAKPEQKDDAEVRLVRQAAESSGEQKSRPPVVVVMGHVDHGKTSLLDYIRSSQVAEGEAGGITQHVGAYHVETDDGMITFMDTPGHEAFSAMRARGAQVTDVVVLVVAADDGVKPQTIEAIQHSKAAEVPMIVAINKIDTPGADVEKVKGELSNHEVVPEDWGGDTMMVEVSAKSGQGIDSLLEAILLQSEVLELKASEEGAAVCTVIESSHDKGRGAVVTVLVQNGTLKKGDVLLAGTECGRIRAIFDENAKPLDKATPSIPAVVFGISGTPSAGEEAVVVDNEREAKAVVEQRREEQRESRIATTPATIEDLFGTTKEGKKELRVLIRADVKGTAEALRDSLDKIPDDEVKLKIIATSVGGITVSDVNLAAASKGMIIGFNTRADAATRKSAEDQDVSIHYYSVIYELIDDVRSMMSDLLSPELREEIVGMAIVKDVFRSSQLGAVAGCQVDEGMVKRGNPIRVLRDQIVVFEGELESLRRHKDDVSEVRAGTECGIAVKDYNDVKVGDHIEVFEKVEVRRSL